MLVLEILYSIFILPIESLLSTLLTFSHLLTDNYGVSIILLSLLFNIIVLPIYHLAELLQQKEKLRLEPMKAKEEKIKRHYKGAEKHFYIKTLHRQFTYHPVQSLKSSLGLFIQVPFFIAAYQMLKSYSQLDGISFGPLQNLGEQDGLLFGWNVLPFIMFGCNLLAGYIYLKGARTSDKIQLWLLSLLFFVILYSQSSGLLLYWTCNNIFSIGKSLISQPTINLTQQLQTKWHAALQTSGWYKLTKARPIISVSFILILLVLGLYAASTFIEADKNIISQAELELAYTYLFLATTAFFIINLLLYKKILLPFEYRNHLLTTGTAVVMLISMCLFIMAYSIDISSIDSLLRFPVNKLLIYIKKGVGNLQLLTLLLLAFTLLLRKWKWLHKERKESKSFYLAITILLLIGLAINPVIFFNASDQLLVSTDFFVDKAISIFVATLLCCWLLFFFSSKGIRNILFATTIYLLAIALFYNFVWVKDYGLLDQFVFFTPDKLKASIFENLFDLLYLLIIAPVFVWLVFRFSSKTKKVWGVMLTAMCIYLLVNFPNENPNAKKTVSTAEKEKAFLTEQSRTLAFSKEQNILIFLLDAFTGLAMNELTRDKQQLFDNFNGFVWYKNTLSSGTNTFASIAALVGGESYTIEAINKRLEQSQDAKAILQDEIDKAYNVYAKAFTQQEWDVVYMNPQFARRINPKVHKVNYDYGNYFLQRNQPEIIDSLEANSEFSMLYILSLFRMLPLSFKEGFYQNGSWSGMEDVRIENAKLYKKAKSWGFLHTLASEMHFKNSKKSFKLIQLQIPHKPSFVKENELLGTTNTSTTIESYMALKKVSDIIDKLKENGSYDNTKIVLLSDHGQYGEYNKDFPIGFVNSIPDARDNELSMSRILPLLMVKDFDSTEPMRISDRFMSNQDLAGIVCAAIKNNCGIKDIDHTKTKLPTKRKLRVTRVKSSRDKFIFIYAYEVEDSIFSPKNWKPVYSLK